VLPIVAIVGRPNVGKSTLFNRLLGQRRAIVDELSGLTRDRHYAEAEWSGRHFLLVDTGGIDPGSAHPIQRQILTQTAQALEEADVALLVVDVTQGIMPLDREVAARVRRGGRPTLVIANKADSAARAEDLSDFYSLGVGDPIPVSALHGRGSGELLDEVIECLPEPEEVPAVEGAIRIAVIGRPNVGKSSLVNKLLGKERMVVDSVAGTTRDAVDTTFERGGKTYVLVDTAGLRRDRKVTDPVEFYSVTRALRAISRADLVLLVLDVSREPSRQDAHLAALAEAQGKAIVVIFNKWDLVEDPPAVRKEIEEEFARQYPFLDFVPRLYLSAASGRGVAQVLPACNEVYEQYARSIPTAELNRVVHEIFEKVRPPATSSGRHLKLYYAAQTGTRPPTFSLFVNNPRYRQQNYVSYLERGLRKRFGFQGAPVVLEWKASH